MPAALPARYAVLGHPVAHSLSPAMHAANFAALGIAATYEAFDVTEETLAAQLDALRRTGYAGVNLTLPLKARALQRVDEAAPSARLLGGVNTIRFEADGRLTGHSTDGFGFLASLREAAAPSLSGSRLLLLGCGGTGRALTFACADAGAAAILLANRTPSRAAELATSLRAAFPACAVQALPADPAVWSAAARDADLVIHTTSQGLHPGDSALLPPAAFRPGQWLIDVVYTAPQTPIMLSAAAAGARVLNGLGMLLHQGAESFRIWTGREPDLNAMRRALCTAAG
jgi:shikimate dehydrogenase